MSPHYYVVIDFECTCWEQRDVENAHEIIEFPAIFVNSNSLKVEYEFHRFVRPTENPILTPFCTGLTGICQSDVDQAEVLTSVLGEFQTFLTDNCITEYTMCTDGPWDFQKFLQPEVTRKKVEVPLWGNKWLDIRRRFEQSYKLEKWMNVNDMLKHMGSEFEGRPHSGIDDARNIARIVCHIHSRDKVKGVMRPNRKLKN
jgi:3'-5' exoribonuclease 1